MHYAHMKDSRKVIVDTSQQQTRLVEGKEYFVESGYTSVWLGGGWQTVKDSNLKKAEYGSPFGNLNARSNT